MVQSESRYPHSRGATTPVVLQKSPPFLKGGEGGFLPRPYPCLASKLRPDVVADFSLRPLIVSQSVSQSVEKPPSLRCLRPDCLAAGFSLRRYAVWVIPFLTIILLTLFSFPSTTLAESKIVFTSYRDGNDEIYVMGVDGTNPVNLTNNFTPYGTGYYYNDFDGQPRWSPDGTKIAFSSW